MKTFLIVEDKVEEQARALEAVKSFYSLGEEAVRFEIIPNCPVVGYKKTDDKEAVSVQFASNLATAVERINFLTKEKAFGQVGVITDLMFPPNKGGKEEPNGLGVIAKCIEAKLPVVVCSDTDHHDVNWLRPIFPILGEAHPAGNIPLILDKKDWEQAVAFLAGVSATV